jgi:transposase
VVDLLSERSAETLSKWLSAHPEVEIISRDRGGIYAQGASEGAPQAQQVADRFHLLQNLTEMMRRILDRQHTVLRDASREDEPAVPEPAATSDELEPARATAEPPKATAAQQRRQALHGRIKELANAGLSMRAISRKLRINRATVRRFIQSDTAPPISARNCPKSDVALEGYAAAVDRLLADDEANAVSIHKEIAQAGFKGSPRSVYRYIRKHHPGIKTRNNKNHPEQGARAAPQQITPRSAAWLLLKDGGNLTEREGRLRVRLEERIPLLGRSAELARRFGAIVRGRKPEELDAWLSDAETSGIPEIRNFAKGLRRDYDAARAGLTLEWSNGPVEGHINRLKLVKRCMYGRGSLELLKRRYIRPT